MWSATFTEGETISNTQETDQNDEKEIVKITTSAYKAELKQIISGNEIIELQSLIRRMPVSDNVIEKTIRLVNHTRPNNTDGDQLVNKYVAWGAGPRASQYLTLGAKAKAALDGRFAPEFSDVIAVAHSVLRHRIITNFTAEAEGINSDQIIDVLIKQMADDR